MKTLRPLAVISFIILLGNISFGQTLIKKFSGEYNLAGADPLGNFYLVHGPVLIKTDSTGNELFSYSDPENGGINFIDVSDPFRTLVYYREYNQLNFLDKTLSPLGNPLALDDLDIYEPAGIAKSSLGGFWAIDRSSSSLLFIDHKLSPVISIKISGLNNEITNTWFPMVEWKKRLYLCVPGKEIRQFDLFGTRIRTIPSGAKSFTSHNGKLLITAPGEVQVLNNMPGIDAVTHEIGIKTWEELHISGNHALVKQQSSWSLYRLKKTF